MKILFALNQNNDITVEEKLLEYYKAITGAEFEFTKEYDLSGVINELRLESFDVLIINEELERDNSITTTYIDDLTDKFSNLRIIMIIKSEHEDDSYVKRLFNLGVYDLLFSNDISIERIVNLIINPRKKAEAKIYLNLHDVEDVVIENELNYIKEDELNTIIGYFKSISEEDYSSTFDHVINQYNETQRIYLINNIPEFILSSLKERSNYNYLKYKANIDKDSNEDEDILVKYKELSSNDNPKEDSTLKKESKFRFPSIGFQQKTIVKEKIVTKVEKEYINIVPDDYKKVVALIGERKSGVTTITSLLASKYSTDKKILVIDVAENGLFARNSWGNERVVEKDNLKELSLNSNLLIIKPKCSTQIMDLIENYKYQNDIILIDADFNFPINILKWIDMVMHISSLDIMDVRRSKAYFRKAMLEGVNLSKVYLVINKHVNCKVKTKDIMVLYKEPIPYIESKNDGIPINDYYHTVPFDEDFYRNSLSSYIYVEEDAKCSDFVDKSISKLADMIYPVNKSGKGKGLISKLTKKIF